MKKLLLAAVTLVLCAFAAPALAANCPTYTYTLTNGQTADANQVMSNFNTIANCANNNLAHNGANSDITSLSSLSTPLTVPQGGTGHGTITSGGLLYGNGASATTVLAPGAGNTFLASNGSVPMYVGITCGNVTNAGNGCTRNVGTTAGTLADGGDNRFTGATGVNFYSSNHTLVAGDAGAVVLCETGMTVVAIPLNATVPYAVGTKIEIVNWFNASGSLQIQTAGGVTLIWAPSGASGIRTLSNQTADVVITYVGSNDWILNGVGVS